MQPCAGIGKWALVRRWTTHCAGIDWPLELRSPPPPPPPPWPLDAGDVEVAKPSGCLASWSELTSCLLPYSTLRKFRRPVRGKGRFRAAGAHLGSGSASRCVIHRPSYGVLVLVVVVLVLYFVMATTSSARRDATELMSQLWPSRGISFLAYLRILNCGLWDLKHDCKEHRLGSIVKGEADNSGR